MKYPDDVSEKFKKYYSIIHNEIQMESGYMEDEIWCNICHRNVVPEKKMNLLIFGLFGGILYLPYYYLFKKKKCPICGNHDFSTAKSEKNGIKPYRFS